MMMFLLYFIQFCVVLVHLLQVSLFLNVFVFDSEEFWFTHFCLFYKLFPRRFEFSSPGDVPYVLDAHFYFETHWNLICQSLFIVVVFHL